MRNSSLHLVRAKYTSVVHILRHRSQVIHRANRIADSNIGWFQPGCGSLPHAYVPFCLQPRDNEWFGR